MRTLLLALACLGSTLAAAQTVTSVYNRDTHEPFQLKNVKVESTVVGPLVRTSTLLTYENPYKNLTEATLNFEMPEAAALGGFAYFYGDEYVKGQLMDKAKAWFIYTAITSRNRDPGLMEQWSPTTYHCQIYPIKKGSDLRVRLWTVGVLNPSSDGKMALPKPQVPKAVGYETVDSTTMEPEWSVRTVKSGPAIKEDDGYHIELNGPVHAVAQRFKDGRTYVAGFIRAEPDEKVRDFEIVSADYGPADGSPGGMDVTERMQALVKEGRDAIIVDNQTFQKDPTPNVFKRLRVAYRVNGGLTETRAIDEHDRFYLTAGDGNSMPEPKFAGLQQAKTVLLDNKTYAFAGWVRRNAKLSAKFGDKRLAIKPQKIAKGSDAARIWAQQVLANDSFKSSREALKFSLKYGVPSNATALLAVPQSEMKLFRQKEREFNKSQAEARRKELEAQRKNRNWQNQRNQNWNSSGGGDPEIRVTIPNAKSVDAILPDRRVIPLTAQGDVWGGNFEIPATAPEGTYRVRILARMADGTTSERSWTYDVDRTAPIGKVELLRENGKLILQVRSETSLMEVAAYAPDGRRWLLKEETPGVYRIELPSPIPGLKVILKDRADNKGEFRCPTQA